MKEALLAKFVGKGEVQIKFRGELQPEPMLGTLEMRSDEKVVEEHHGAYGVGVEVKHVGESYFVFHAKMHMRTGEHSRPKPITLPIVFDAADVLWLSEGPLNENGEKLVVDMAPKPPANGSGLVIPAR